MYKDNYILISPRTDRKDCRYLLYRDYKDLFKLPYENVFLNPEDCRNDDLWYLIERYKFKIKNQYFSVFQETDGTIVLKEKTE